MKYYAMKESFLRAYDDHVHEFSAGKERKMAYYNNLWNLTLSQ